jgi:hypothetical protein
MLKGSMLGFFTVLLAACSFSAVAQAEASAPGYEVLGYFNPTDLAPGGTGVLDLLVYDVGGESSSGPVKIVDRLPDGVLASSAPVHEGCPNLTGVGTSEFVCEIEGLQPAFVPIKVEIPVGVPTGLSGQAVDQVEIAGGGALAATKSTVPVTFSAGEAPVGFSNFQAWLSNPDGTVDTQAGSHPYAFNVAFSMNNKELPDGEYIPTGGEAHGIDVKLPPGLVGDPTAVPRCPRSLLDNGESGLKGGVGCPASTQIGEVQTSLRGLGGIGYPLFNIVPPPGDAAEFAFVAGGGTTVFFDSRVRSGGDYGITSHTANVPQRSLLFFSATIWGTPGEASHNAAREVGRACNVGEGCGFKGAVEPLLTLPTSCASAPEFLIEETSTWQEQHMTPAKRAFHSLNNEGEEAGVTGCERLAHFEPTIAIAPDTTQADSPAGLTTTVKVPQEVNPEELATSGLKDTTVTLPEGMAINPGQATGLQACQPSQENIAPGTEAGESEAMDGPSSCPSASKVGEDEISTPLLPERLKGSVYVLQSNPPDLKLLVVASGEGVSLKLVGTVHLNEKTGQLVTTFENTPDAPLNEFKLSFSGGAQAALVTPPTCRVYSTTSVFTPWSSPLVENGLVQGRFGIETGPDGAPCTPYGSSLPFSPSLVAGATTDQAGGYTNFSLLLQRGDGQQRFSSLSFKAPEGLSAMIASVPLCGEAQASEGTCPEASKIGHAVVGAGPGPYPFYIPQNGAPPAAIYLTGPYEGAPFGLSIVTPVVAGPFNLGTNVVRAKIEINPLTAQITVTTDPSGPHSIPTILDGIPTDIRSINTVIEHPDFMFNPTNCSPQEFSGTAYSGEGASASISSHFQVGSCQALKFAPNFKVSTTGRASKAQGASLTVKIVYPTGNLGANQASSQSNIASAKVELPKQLPSRLTTLQKACTNAQFEANPAGCPAASVVGYARVLTPILPVPLEGPAFFVSHGGEAYPSLIVVLQGYGVTVELVGTTFISKTGITSSTFKATPDVPFGSFELTLPRSKYSALTVNLPEKDHYDLCGQTLAMPTTFTAQNGAVVHESTPVTVTGCPKLKAAKQSKKAKRKSKAHESRRRNRGGK